MDLTENEPNNWHPSMDPVATNEIVSSMMYQLCEQLPLRLHGTSFEGFVKDEALSKCLDSMGANLPALWGTKPKGGLGTVGKLPLGLDIVNMMRSEAMENPVPPDDGDVTAFMGLFLAVPKFYLENPSDLVKVAERCKLSKEMDEKRLGLTVKTFRANSGTPSVRKEFRHSLGSLLPYGLVPIPGTFMLVQSKPILKTADDHRIYGSMVHQKVGQALDETLKGRAAMSFSVSPTELWEIALSAQMLGDHADLESFGRSLLMRWQFNYEYYFDDTVKAVYLDKLV